MQSTCGRNISVRLITERKPREKTAVLSRIPLLPYPLALLKKYERDAEVRTAGKLLPVPSNQKMNAYLKEIADLCNIPKNLTTP